MPANFTDISVPELQENGDIRELIRKILNYEVELREFLEWKLNNLDVRNMNIGKLPDISAGVVAPVAAQAQAALTSIGDLAALKTAVKTSLASAINELEARVAALEEREE